MRPGNTPSVRRGPAPGPADDDGRGAAVFLCDCNVGAGLARDASLLAGIDPLLTSSARTALSLASHSGALVAVLGATVEGWDETLDSYRDLSIPVIVVGRGDAAEFLDQNGGIDLGLLAPVDVASLARSIALMVGLRSSGRVGPRTLELGPFALDPWTREVRVGGAPLALAPKQYALLHRLLDRPGRLVRSRELVATVWPEAPGMTINDLHWHVSRLRRRLRAAGLPEDTIVNRRGLGYSLNVPSAGGRGALTA